MVFQLWEGAARMNSGMSGHSQLSCSCCFSLSHFQLLHGLNFAFSRNPEVELWGYVENSQLCSRNHFPCCFQLWRAQEYSCLYFGLLLLGLGELSTINP